MDWKLERCTRHLYVLELENGKFYVGQAKDPDRRIRKHFNGSGSEWTRLHAPVKELMRESLQDVDYRAAELAENELVLKLMRQYGFHNVRGGFFANTSVEHVEKNLVSHGHGCVVSAGLANLVDPPVVEAVHRLSTQPPGQFPEASSTSRHVLSGAEYGLFVLKLEGGYYFVGYSTKPNVRINRHFAGKGADWTSLHRPIEVLSKRSLGFLTESQAATKATDATVALMRLFGWEKVRGGIWRSVDEEVTFKQLRLSGHTFNP
ncbi:GIY-YIG nuclease family protein [Pseudomonas sp. ICMP22404]|uniref:GIY-YIG nuclease family protein n=1 Tax=Pseudomonas sp. ICMP22404 TaxID=2583807 RepID=UPI001119A161|nr:GIY-YIG nuclease family protein [Pseudomonas sp. ICMP22404]TNF78776.1 GIY-YIG nuclease family protein [Pseudomonas sp. ICMP22404]